MPTTAPSPPPPARSRWGWHTHNYVTYRRFKRYQQLLGIAYRQFRRWQAWQGKQPHNRKGGCPPVFPELVVNLNSGRPLQPAAELQPGGRYRFGAPDNPRNPYLEALGIFRQLRTPQPSPEQIPPQPLPPDWLGLMERLERAL